MRSAGSFATFSPTGAAALLDPSESSTAGSGRLSMTNHSDSRVTELMRWMPPPNGIAHAMMVASQPSGPAARPAHAGGGPPTRGRPRTAADVVSTLLGHRCAASSAAYRARAEGDAACRDWRAMRETLIAARPPRRAKRDQAIATEKKVRGGPGRPDPRRPVGRGRRGAGREKGKHRNEASKATKRRIRRASERGGKRRVRGSGARGSHLL